MAAAHRPWVRRTKVDPRRRPEGRLPLAVTTRRRAARQRPQSARPRDSLSPAACHSTLGLTYCAGARCCERQARKSEQQRLRIVVFTTSFLPKREALVLTQSERDRERSGVLARSSGWCYPVGPPFPPLSQSERDRERSGALAGGSGRGSPLGPPLPPLSQSGRACERHGCPQLCGVWVYSQCCQVVLGVSRYPRRPQDPSLDMWDFSPLISLWINRFYIYLGFAFGFSLWICFQIVIRRQLGKDSNLMDFVQSFILKDENSQEKSVSKATQDLMTNGDLSLQEKEVFVSGVKIFYGSQTGTAKHTFFLSGMGFATILAEAVSSLGLPVAIINLKEYDPDDHLVEEGFQLVEFSVSIRGVECVVIFRDLSYDKLEMIGIYSLRNGMEYMVTSKNVCAFLVATYTDGRPTESAEWFCKWLEEASIDFRFGKTYLKGMRYAVFGLGNSAYASHFNKVGKNVDKWLWMLGAHRLMTRGEGDCDVVKSKHGSIEGDFRAWKTKFISRLQALSKGEKKSCGGNCKKGRCKSNQHSSEEMEAESHTQDRLHQRDTEEEEPLESTSEEESDTEDHQSLNSVIDVEDLGKIMNHVKKEKREKEQQEEKTSLFRNTAKNEASERRAMITPALREALTKQGYQLIGSHSGVKLCRWTKIRDVNTFNSKHSMLRGRGGCYKHTFYGIESHRCMETTPSLACANKCVFCWRHHTNPVGTEWRWKMDQPEMILKEAIENHQSMIKQFKGKVYLYVFVYVYLSKWARVPGVKEERFEEGMTVKHCALSLVGEPIMYPEINRFLKLLHEYKISSFLVTNAQFPAEIRSKAYDSLLTVLLPRGVFTVSVLKDLWKIEANRNLKPVTQLYVSVDASTKDSLKKIDRPLFKDFWQRFLDSLKALAAKLLSPQLDSLHMSEFHTMSSTAHFMAGEIQCMREILKSFHTNICST
ncbi:hypothetical protein HPG69_005132 [Diceros bicornis minor]|uniref:tRNA 4-demethylwyosine synthase (AdoMet-dependent) n=1 Tax=Diceros bicornis minor TaxID=77932 RepID=A0A7J7EFR8_DICBM|nr:hypothetical protein HPG69_005132 [Diceros bicornis minor]